SHVPKLMVPACPVIQFQKDFSMEYHCVCVAAITLAPVWSAISPQKRLPSPMVPSFPVPVSAVAHAKIVMALISPFQAAVRLTLLRSRPSAHKAKPNPPAWNGVQVWAPRFQFASYPWHMMYRLSRPD